MRKEKHSNVFYIHHDENAAAKREAKTASEQLNEQKKKLEQNIIIC